MKKQNKYAQINIELIVKEKDAYEIDSKIWDYILRFKKRLIWYGGSNIPEHRPITSNICKMKKRMK